MVRLRCFDNCSCVFTGSITIHLQEKPIETEFYYKSFIRKVNFRSHSEISCLYVYDCMCAHVCICVFVCVCICMYVCLYVCVCLLVCVCVHMCMHVWLYVPLASPEDCLLTASLAPSTKFRLCVIVCVHMCVYECLYVCLFVCVSACMCV